MAIMLNTGIYIPRTHRKQNVLKHWGFPFSDSNLEDRRMSKVGSWIIILTKAEQFLRRIYCE